METLSPLGAAPITRVREHQISFERYEVTQRKSKPSDLRSVFRVESTSMGSGQALIRSSGRVS